MKNKIYFKHDSPKEAQNPFCRKASAVCVDLDEWYVDAKFHEPTFQFSDNTYCGFIYYKVYEIWEGIPYEMGGLAPFDTYEETTLLHEGLWEAKSRLSDYIQKFNVEKNEDILWAWNVENEYRIIIDKVEFVRGLKDLSEFISESAAKPNKSIEFWL